MPRDVDVNLALNKVAEVTRELNAHGFHITDDGGQDIWPHLYAQEFLHELMREGEWHICHHAHPKDPTDET
jgi:hypothetical protein